MAVLLRIEISILVQIKGMRRFILLLVLIFYGAPETVAQLEKYRLKRKNTFFVPEEVEETSGLFTYKGEIYTFNDSGGLPMIYGLDTLGGRITRRIYVHGAKNVDWEAVEIVGNTLYIGDFGNNRATRTDLVIYKAEFDTGQDTITVTDTITFSYPDQTSYEKRKYDHNFDCEAMVVHNDSIFLYSKSWADGESTIRAIPNQAGNYQAEIIATFSAKGLITDAAFDRENNHLALVGYSFTGNVMLPFIWLIHTDHPGKVDIDSAKRIALEPIYTQIEGVTFLRPEMLVMTAEALNNKLLDIAPALFMVNVQELQGISKK